MPAIFTVQCSSATAYVTSVHELQIPEKARAACNKGTQRFAERDSAGGIAEFQQAIKAFPDYYEAYAELGAAELNLNKWDDAESAFRKSIELSGGHYAPADFGLGLILATVKKQFIDAEKFIRDGLNVDPSDVTGRFVLAWVLYSTARLQEAEKSAREVVLSAPKFAAAQLLLAQIHLGERNLSGAVKDLDVYLSSGAEGPLNDKARLVRAEALQQLSLQAGESAKVKSGGNAVGRADLR